MDELERFKIDINLSEYAASCGYELDRRESSRNSAIMRHANGDKIIIARGLDGHWIYFSVRDDADNGTIIDFVQKRENSSLGITRKILRPWIGGGDPPKRPLKGSFAVNVEKVSKDIAKVLASLGSMQAVISHNYLEGRGISPNILADNRFTGRLYIDGHHNAVFPHWNRSGVCGYEVKNRDFTGFAPGGEKGLWISKRGEPNQRLVIAESAIDALSHATLFPDPAARYASIGGKMNPEQPDLIEAAIKSLPEGGEVVAATDADEDGRKLALQIGGIAKKTGRAFSLQEPPEEGTDWNDHARPGPVILSIYDL
ncbi:hypothetical protein DSCO28_73750 (plasmid) [Desulfosarcina ovata subsp. sediminis]|uniref:Toprim domain-containing protein n=1 Tax=Desulfosarcina ovata subsp. sediminis TaxID=885957 RepID=A0A5K8A2Q7_9BACT|nr:DUF3991 and TOPRIM domain-containing protein [Desulfosarcina ovata]BBO86809.1 hypothetical protein DSCO28_73750 [Desulfosarcina ovata subsp. sediminis]